MDEPTHVVRYRHVCLDQRDGFGDWLTGLRCGDCGEDNDGHHYGRDDDRDGEDRDDDGCMNYASID